MNKKFVKSLFAWLFLWFFVQGFFLVVLKMSLVENPFFSSFYYVGASVGVFYLYHKSYKVFEEHFSGRAVVFLVLMFVVNFVLYYIANNYFIRPEYLIERYGDAAFLRMDYWYILSKSFEILFQQVMIFNLIVILKKNGEKLLVSSIIFGLFFSVLGHAFLLSVHGGFMGMFYILGASLAVLVFPIIISKVNYGFVYTYIIHWMYYSVCGFVIWFLGYVPFFS